MTDDDDRPDPDALLARIRQDEARAARGRLKVFFGASAGVGKTFAMLAAARALHQQGQDVLVGVIETHGRAETQALLDGLPRLPLKAVDYKGRSLQEFDLEGALQRRPALILVDELAHSNVAGCRHPKRWQDVEELLAAGIDVWTTMNVQHLDSLNDVVSGITGVRVWETVPDRVFDAADDVVLVDLPPDELLLRLKQGKVYLPQQAERAVDHFFRKGNLIALRELALRRTADRVDDQMQAYRRELSGVPVWQTRGAVLAGIGPDERSERVVRAAARLAGQLDVPWHAVFVETPALQRLPDAARQRIVRLLKLAQDLGASTATLPGTAVADTLVRYAREHNLSRLLLGHAPPRHRLPWGRIGLAQHIARLAADLDLVQVSLAGTPRNAAAPPAFTPAERIPWVGYAMSAVVCAAVALLAAPLAGVFETANIVMLFLLGVVGVAVRWGRGPAVLAAVLAVGAFDFFYVEPRFSFSVSDVQYLLTFAVMLVVALVIGQMTAGLKQQARVAVQRESRMRALYELARELAGALLAEQVAEVVTRFARSQFDARAALLPVSANDRLLPALPAPEPPAGIDASVAQWAYARGQDAGLGTDTLPGSPLLYLPLRAPMRIRGVLVVEPADAARLLLPEQRRLLETCASLAGLALERLHYVDVAQASTLQMEGERLRNSLLAAISHDLRTPLAALVGMADTLAGSAGADEAQRSLGRRMREAALRMSALVTNLLDMARLESGRIRLNRQWLPLEEVVGTALQAVGPLLAAHPVRADLPAELPLLHVDAVLMERVLVNLLENAAKYTPPGTPIQILAVAYDEEVSLIVQDRGPGLPLHKEEAIFEKFERGRAESATPGVGLGLAICRAIVQAHGGTIRAENRPGGGARFEIRLPRGEPPPLPAGEPLPGDHATDAADAAADRRTVDPQVSAPLADVTHPVAHAAAAVPVPPGTPTTPAAER
ncbi:MAG: two-component system sensor histidine kinase KdbD [Burkholderiales bacterium]|nr:two-component system sensor histidine kinase KdbD [Burkholderiales bacterium]